MGLLAALLLLEDIGILGIEVNLYKIIGLGVGSCDVSKHNTWLRNYLLKELNSTRNHLDIILALQIDPELGNDNQIIFSAVGEVEVLSFVSIRLIVDLGIILILQAVGVHIRWFFVHSSLADLAFNLVELEVAFPAKSLLLLLHLLQLQVLLSSTKLAPS